MPPRVALRRTCARTAASLALALALASLASIANAGDSGDAPAAPPVIYKWVDENGVAHYTTDRSRIPSTIRDRVESRHAAPAQTPAATAQPTQEDLLRDAAHSKPAAGTSTAPVPASGDAAAAAAAIPAPRAAAPAPVAPAPAPEFEDGGVASGAPADSAPARAATRSEPPAVSAPPAPAPPADADSVSAPPPAPAAPIDPKQKAQLDELDRKIQAVQEEISQREEQLAALISTADDQRTTPLVDDPKFREISQTLPKLQADLQTLRDRRNKIQPATATP